MSRTLLLITIWTAGGCAICTAADTEVTQRCTLGPWEGEMVALPEGTAPSEPFVLDHTGSRVRILDGQDPVLEYVYGLHLIDGVPEDRRRSGYIHPLYGLDGEILTEDFPKDHYHHRGLYWTWPRVFYREPDNLHDMWHLNGAWSRFEQWLGSERGPCCAVIGARNGWYDASNNRILEETVWLRVWRADTTGRSIDVDLSLRPIGAPIWLQGQPDGRKGYGGFCYRPAPANEIRIATPEGEVMPQGRDNLPARWIDYTGLFHGRKQRSGIAIFPAPDHPDYPPGWITRSYGFMGINWPGPDPRKITPDEPVTLRYRVRIHRGDTGEAKVAEAFARYLDSWER